MDIGGGEIGNCPADCTRHIGIGRGGRRLLQPGKSAGMPGAIAGGAQTFFGKKKGLDEKLARVTTAFAILFMISSVVLAFVVGR